MNNLPKYVPPPSISPEVNQGRKDCLDGKLLFDNPYNEISDYENWAMWKTGYLEQCVLIKRETHGLAMPN